MNELLYDEHIERTRHAIMKRIEQAREHSPSSPQHEAYLRTAGTILTGLTRNFEVADEDYDSLRRRIDAERGT
ncbi:hypothetical protein [Paraburkholderia solisilvae]|uniref:Uncharacterized protein n=1 Tax=Paraburkholderia solisilvae TaxID=624376 RepID=A0A6J5EYB2_9BURK|nr:hypothetical protein [Paraburkholderia solisilvae]CAB3770447.1 hypothetical protein LMG29739_05784 [Paraburkholderia solisilvae]